VIKSTRFWHTLKSAQQITDKNKNQLNSKAIDIKFLRIFVLRCNKIIAMILTQLVAEFYVLVNSNKQTLQLMCQK
jgi:hypothetical protein